MPVKSGESPGWLDAKVGDSKLAQSLSPYLDNWLAIKARYKEPLIIKINNAEFIVEQKAALNEKLYTVYRDGCEHFIISMDIQGRWTANAEIEQEIINSIGLIIKENEY